MEKILAIDDLKDNLISLKATFKRYMPECELLTTTSGKEGIEIARNHQPDVIILDIIMPEMNGYEVCKRLKADKLTKNIPVLMLTAVKTDSESFVKGLSYGADAFFSKPIDPAELSAQVKVMLRIKNVEEMLRNEQEMLEELVEERTQELLNTNSRLMKEIKVRKKTENKLKTALVKAEEADKLKSNFLASVSHELRTPLNAVIGFSELITEDTPINEIIDYVNIIKSSGADLLELVEGIFDITLLDSGQLKVIKTEFSIDSFFERIHNKTLELQQKTDKPNLIVTLQINDDTKACIIRSDQNKIEKIINYLIKNALEFTNEGSIKYGASVRQDSQSDYLEIFVEDTGIGIPEDKQNLIFEKFRKADEQNIYGTEGLGIGLALTKKLVNLLEGTITVSSEPGKGSIFTVQIPIKRKDAKRSSKKDQSGKHINGKPAVLVAEDEDSSYQLMYIWIKKEGYKVLRARNGKEAVQKSKEAENLGLVLMDIKMPVMNGYEATRSIKQENPDIPVIAQTAFAASGDREKAFDAGCDAHLTKPVRKDILLKMLNKYLSGDL